MAMAESAVSLAVSKIGDLILNEAALLGNTRRDVEWLQRELRMMQASLDDLATREIQDARSVMWTMKLQQLASDAEKVLGKFYFHFDDTSARSCFNCRIKSRRNFGLEIKRLKQRVAEFAKWTDKDPSGGILSYVANKVGGFTGEEDPLLSNMPAEKIREDLKCLQRDLQTMQADLDHLATMEIRDVLTNTWIEETRKLAFDAEDVIDSFSLRRHGNDKANSSMSGKFATTSDHEFGAKIAQLRKKVADLQRMKETYGIEILHEMNAGAVHRRDELLQFRRLMATPYVEDRDVVGLSRHVKELTKWLDREGSSRSVVSIVGMGGLGKTTLAKKVYNNLRWSSSSFGCSAWVCVSQAYNILDLVRSIAWEILKLSRKDVQEMNQDAILVNLKEFLQSEKYLIVLDDVWSTDVWDNLCNILPDPNNGSRVIITTRNVKVAKLANPKMPPFELTPLSEEEGRILFTKKVFPDEENPEKHYTEELTDLGNKIVEKCRGLPLAIIIVGGLLSVREKSPREWEKVAEKTVWSEKGLQFMRTLQLSYMDLPVHLRWCFLYLAAIPEDCEVHANRLMRLWIAEGFIKEEAQNSLEKIAERYLEELVDRGLIQVVERTPYGSVEVCRVHDLLLELAVDEANKRRFLDVWRTTPERHPGTLLRRLSFTTACIKGTTHLPLGPDKLRTLLIMDPRDWKRGEDTYLVVENIAGNIEWSSIQRNLKLLRVLELRVYLHHLPDEIEDMVNLRYISLSSHKRIKLPKSLGNLRHLQTLDVGTANVSCLPVSIWRIKTLRYLRGGWETRIPAPEIPRPTHGFLQDLRSLRHVRAHPWMEDILPKLSNLRELEICRDRDGSIPDYLCSTIKSLQSLEVLILVERNLSYGGKSILHIDDIFRGRGSHPNLHTLELSDLEVISSNIQELPRELKQVKLAYARIHHGLIELLGKLPSLHLLRLSEVSIVEEEMIFQSDWFRQLTVLVLDDLNIETWKLVGQSLPLLREPKISRCSRLKTLPKNHPLLGNLMIVQGEPSQLHKKFTGEDQKGKKLEGEITLATDVSIN